MIRVFRDFHRIYTNRIINGLSASWTGTGATVAYVTDHMNITGNGTSAYCKASQAQFTSVAGHKYFVRVKFKVTNADCTDVSIKYGLGLSQQLAIAPTADFLYEISAIIEATTNSTTLELIHQYASSAIANGKVMSVYNIVIYDLTEADGAGNEHTLAEFNGILGRNATLFNWATANFDLNDYTTNGDKVINPLKCLEVNQDNEDWVIELDADLADQPYLIQDYLLIVPTKQGLQPFRIRNISVDGYKVSLKARHVGYDLENYSGVYMFGTTFDWSASAHLNYVVGLSTPLLPFTISTDLTSTGIVVYKDNSTLGLIDEIRLALGGHLVFNWWDVQLKETIGTDKGMTVRYGKDLLDAKLDEDWNSVCTTLFPFGNNNLTLATNPPSLTATGVAYDRPYVVVQTFKTDDVVELERLGNLYLEKYKVPKINYTVQADDVQDVSLGDTIKVVARQFTILTNVLGYTYNVLTKRIEKVEFGNFRRDVKSVFSNIQGQLSELEKKLIQENIQMNAKLPTATKGTNYSVLKYPDGRLEMFGFTDVTQTIATAWGTAYTMAAAGTLTYPTDEAFTSVQYCDLNCAIGTGGTALARKGTVGLLNCTYFLDRQVAATSAVYRLMYHILGRWD